jgi:hypothetical protein
MARQRQGDFEEIDLDALLWERVPKGPQFGAEDVRILAASVRQYVKHLENMAVEAQKLGRDREAGNAQRDAGALIQELIGDLDADPPTRGRLHQRPPLVLPGHMKPLEKGLELYLKNLRSAKGTMRGLGKDELAGDFEEEATIIEGRLLLCFQEQGTLPLEKPKKPDGAGLKEMADATAEIEERKQAAEGEGADAPVDPPGEENVTPIAQAKRRRKVK